MRYGEIRSEVEYAHQAHHERASVTWTAVGASVRRLAMSVTERGIRAGVLESQAHGKDIPPTKRSDMKRGLTTLPIESGFFEK